MRGDEPGSTNNLHSMSDLHMVVPGESAHSCVQMHQKDRKKMVKMFVPVIVALCVLVFILAVMTGYFAGKQAAGAGGTPHTSKKVSPPTQNPMYHRNVELDARWIQWKSHYGKTYANQTENMKRRMIWEINLKFINNHNIEYALGRHTHLLGLNRFSDLTQDEFRNRYAKGGCIGKNRPAGTKKFVLKNNYDFKSTAYFEWNWYAMARVRPAKNQGQCGSCWAFSAVGAIESHFAILNNTSPVPLSEQQMVDCSVQNHGCEGGLPSEAFRYLMNSATGLMPSHCYRYQGRKANATCLVSQMSPLCQRHTVKLRDFVNLVPRNETRMMEALIQEGPLTVGIDAGSKHMQSYPNGGLVLNPPDCKSQLNHAVLIVGFGRHLDRRTGRVVPYWLVKNSWGVEWGDRGFFKLARGVNACGIAEIVSYPIVA